MQIPTTPPTKIGAFVFHFWCKCPPGMAWLGGLCQYTDQRFASFVKAACLGAENLVFVKK